METTTLDREAAFLLGKSRQKHESHDHDINQAGKNQWKVVNPA
jgi:hypothetical protein